MHDLITRIQRSKLETERKRPHSYVVLFNGAQIMKWKTKLSLSCLLLVPYQPPSQCSLKQSSACDVRCVCACMHDDMCAWPKSFQQRSTGQCSLTWSVLQIVPEMQDLTHLSGMKREAAISYYYAASQPEPALQLLPDCWSERICSPISVKY